jgi:hypothetical protein
MSTREETRKRPSKTNKQGSDRANNKTLISIMKLADINLAESVVPFGGSATPVVNPSRAILGGKGLGLQEMGRIGVDVPPGCKLFLCLTMKSNIVTSLGIRTSQ